MLTVLVNKKAKQAEHIEWKNLSLEELAGMATTEALFGGHRVFVLEGALYGERGSEFLSMADVLVASTHTFYFEEEKLLKAETDALTKAGVKIEKKEKAEKKVFTFDQFGVASALGTHDKKKLWIGLMRAFDAGEKAEAIGGLLCWKAREMKDVALSRKLVCMYHDSHRGAGELELLLERFALML
jgi:hypothetical protein